MSHIKKFLEWMGVKERLHSVDAKPPLVSEGNLWWASIGENVGSEIDGKSRLFSRPVIVYKKLAHGFYFVIPTTTKIKEGSWYMQFRHKEKDMVACLHQARSIDFRRLSTKMGSLDDSDMKRLRASFGKLYK